MELNSPPILKFLEAMTGIEALIADPYYEGGGLHEIKRGGHLGVHADFNIHKGMNVERRLNLLVYLNDDWDQDYGGALEFWDKDMKACRHRVAPTIGRAVVFNTGLDSFHGHPDPLNCPPERSRRSIATYYYTARADVMSAVPDRTTVFRPRPASGDRSDRRVQFDRFLRDWVPPRLYRYATRLNRFK
jgi:Rps23 Pro-64 3,4-dihydroxylase Tpa1-like proline 4-hydroxylase